MKINLFSHEKEISQKLIALHQVKMPKVDVITAAPCVCGEGLSNVYVDWMSNSSAVAELILELHFLTTVDRKKIVVCSIFV